MESLNGEILCRLCPRNCGIDRNLKNGFCGAGNKIKIARYGLHMWEEPCVSGEKGSGTVFFSGCPLKCVFCQNYEISCKNKGKYITEDDLERIFLYLQENGACNINLVSPTHYSDKIVKVLDRIKHKLYIPVVYNTGGYEKSEEIEKLRGYIDVFLPDLKYVSSELSGKYSGAKNYFEYASKAVIKMFDIAGYPKFENGRIISGVIVRHLVLPSHVEDSFKVVDFLSENLDCEKLYLSIMRQYFPSFNACKYKEISRKLTSLEYKKVIDYAISKGIKNGFMQDKNTSEEEYVPDFSGEELILP